MREVPKTIIGFSFPRRDPSDPEEGLVFYVHPETGALVCQLELTAEHFRAYSFERPLSIPIPPDAAVNLAHELLRAFAPDVADFLERAVVAASLRIVQGGPNGPEAA